MVNSIITFDEVQSTQQQLQTLYQLLVSREYAISHQTIPSYNEHVNFVSNHPYRFWVLVFINTECVGSVYLHQNNLIGINIIKGMVAECFETTLNYITKKFKPLPTIQSVRTGYFVINVSPSNTELITEIEKNHGYVYEYTYRF